MLGLIRRLPEDRLEPSSNIHTARSYGQSTVELRKYVSPSCAHSRPCRARRSRWSVQVALRGSLQAFWAMPASLGNSRKHRSSKSEIVSAQIAASTPATCPARLSPSASAGFQSNDSPTVLGE